jgi:hypothetical protein
VAHVYRDQDEKLYKADMGQAYTHTKQGESRDHEAQTRYYKEWRTYHMSDHLPMWIELKTDFGKEYLRAKIGV